MNACVAWRVGRRRGWARRLAGVLLGALAVLLLAVTGVLGRGLVTAYTARNFPVPQVTAPSDAATIARGEQIARSTCSACHNANTCCTPCPLRA